MQARWPRSGAINEVRLERAFGLDPIQQGALAICGFGWRGEVMETAELDPAGEVWRHANDIDTTTITLIAESPS